MSVLFTRFLNANDYNSWYANYVKLCRDSRIDVLLKDLKTKTLDCYQQKPDSWYLNGYAEGKWSPLTLLEHMVDTEVIFTTRLLACLRGSDQNWPGFDENAFAANGQAHEQSVSFQLKRMELVRENSILMCELVNESNYHQRMLADGKEFSSLAILAIIAGHNAHHLNVLNDRYPVH